MLTDCLILSEKIKDSKVRFIAVFLFIIISVGIIHSESWIRINQLGYEPNSIKVAVLISEEKIDVNEFKIRDAISNRVVFTSKKISNEGKWEKFNSTFRLNFSEFKKEGLFVIEVNEICSPIFRVREGIYNNSTDFLLQYIRQQQCGYNPFLNDSCHTHDGFIIYHPSKDSQHIDVVGGFHDASDYLRYVTTTATTVFHLLFAYYKNPVAFKDEYSADGRHGSDGVPDVLNSAKWGIDWLMKMNPSENEYYNQVADDRDHRGFRLPNEDSISYGRNLERPVYFVTGEPQGLFKYKNRTTGVSSTVAKFSSTFGFASYIFKELDSSLSNELKERSIKAFKFSKTKPGYTQTAPCRAPYFYEEENYNDDLELASVVLSFLFNSKEYLNEAIEFGRLEKITSWIGKDTVRHYQWYPFINLAHYFIAKKSNPEVATEFINYYKTGLELIKKKCHSNPFRIGVPFIWCSNNLIANLLTQFRLYHELTGDEKFLELEAAHRDWLFGCNPWGTSMIVGFPEWGDYPSDPHSAFSAIYGYKINGGLVDGPVYTSIYKNLIGITLHQPDEYEKFQTDFIVYHDDYGDYSTNEPTLDGTASLILYLSFLYKKSIKEKNQNIILDNGGIVRFDTSKAKIYLLFSGHKFGEGLDFVLKVLKKNKITASFFFTGDFLRNKKFKKLIKRLINDGHYLGPHSDKHILYCDWLKRDSLLINQDDFNKDLLNNLNELRKYGIDPTNLNYFLPPFEWYNQEIVNWTKWFGMDLISFTSNTFTNADYTTPDMKNYLSSEEIIQKLIVKHRQDRNGLNGCILLFHVGTNPNRTDKLYLRLDEIIKTLKAYGYTFSKLP